MRRGRTVWIVEYDYGDIGHAPCAYNANLTRKAARKELAELTKTGNKRGYRVVKYVPAK